MNTYRVIALAVMMILLAPLGYAATYNGSGQVSNYNGGMQLGQFGFSVGAAGSVTIAVQSSDFDSFIRLYDLSIAEDANKQIAFNDNDPNDIWTSNSYLELILGPGNYLVAIGPEAGFSAAHGLAGFRAGIGYTPFDNGQDASFGNWTITVNTPVAVPVPAALPLFFSALSGLLLLGRKSFVS
jgi:hypothetical protein